MSEKTVNEIEVEGAVVDETPIDTHSLIVVKQIPIIEERLMEIKGIIEQEVSHALSLECTEENKQEIKKLRAELNKKFEALETDRKKVKSVVLDPYNAFEAVYKDCVTNVIKPADAQLRDKIAAVENAQKEAKRVKAVEYFNEYAAAHNIDFVTFENVGVQITLNISDKKLKETCKAFIDRIVGDLALIDTQEHKADILVEYKKSLNVSQAITSVKNRYQAIEDEKRRIAEAEERAKAEAERQRAVEEAIAQEQEPNEGEVVEAPTPIEAPVSAPVVEDEPQEKHYNVKFAFQLNDVTKEQAIRAKKHFEEYLKKEGIDYAIIK